MNCYLHDITNQMFDTTDTPCKPSPKAIRRTLHLLYRTSRVQPIPRATVCPDVTGSLYVIWRNGWRRLHLIVPANPATPMLITQTSYEPHAINATEHISEPSRLAELLAWYVERSILEAEYIRPDTILDHIDNDGVLELFLLDAL